MAHMPNWAQVDGPWLGLGWSATLQWSDLTLQQLCLTTQRLDQWLSSLGDVMLSACLWSWTIHARFQNTFSQLVTFGLNQIFISRRSVNYSRTVRAGSGGSSSKLRMAHKSTSMKQQVPKYYLTIEVWTICDWGRTVHVWDFKNLSF